MVPAPPCIQKSTHTQVPHSALWNLWIQKAGPPYMQFLHLLNTVFVIHAWLWLQNLLIGKPDWKISAEKWTHKVQTCVQGSNVFCRSGDETEELDLNQITGPVFIPLSQSNVIHSEYCEILVSLVLFVIRISFFYKDYHLQ